MNNVETMRTRKNGSSFLSPFLKQNQGSFTLNGAIMLFFVMLLLVLGITVLGAVNNSMKLHSVAADLTRYIEIRGQVDTPVYTEMTRLADVAGVTIDQYNIQTENGESKIQFGSSFTVTLTTTSHFGVGGVLSVPVPLKAVVTGRSEKYWK